MIPAERFLAHKADDFEAWLEARRSGVTATQVANAATPAGFERAAADFLTEWREPDNPYMKFGRDWESHIADYVEKAFQVSPNEWLVAGENPMHLATPDGISENHTVIGEYKTTGKDWGHVEKLPLRYKRQIQWQLHVTGAQSCIVSWLVREEVDGEFVPAAFTPVSGIMFRDEDMIAELVTVADRLWAFVNGENSGT
jgi:hypothetical protein